MRTRIKFCGLTRPGDIRLAAELGVDALGFVFAEASPRRLDATRVAALREAVSAGVEVLAYGAVILSFVGALHWGFAMAQSGLSTAERTRCFVWSVVPSLMAWPATLLPPAGGAALLVTGFVAHLVQDHRLAARTSLPAWYLPLRWRLTTTACVCLAVGAMAASR